MYFILSVSTFLSTTDKDDDDDDDDNDDDDDDDDDPSYKVAGRKVSVFM